MREGCKTKYQSVAIILLDDSLHSLLYSTDISTEDVVSIFVVVHVIEKVFFRALSI